MDLPSYNERSNFVRELFNFLKSRNISNLKVPQIGGKELDLLALYTAVIKRGGAENVSNKKLWKEIVNEFDLPPSCTSASFTLKNHYQKYLLAYEQKVYFNKDESDVVKELGKLRNSRKNLQNQTISYKKKRNDNLEQSLINSYKNKIKSGGDVYFIERKRLVPFSSEIRRIVLSFESKLISEIRYSLNCLLLYSVSQQSPFVLDNYRILWEGFKSYFLFVFKKLKNSLHFESDRFCDANLIDVIDFDYNEQSLNKSELLEQFKIILTILRNLIFIPENENVFVNDKKIMKYFFEISISNNNFEINKLVMEIFGVLSKYIILDEKITNHLHFLEKIIKMINSDYLEEYELGIENMHNLMMNQENENLIENKLLTFIKKLVNLLLSNTYNVLEKVLEIICHFSDLKISTRVSFAKEDNFFERLLGLIGGHSKKNRKIAKISSIILKNIVVTPTTRVFLKPYENDLFLIISHDSLVSETMSEVLLQIQNVNYNMEERNKSFYTKMFMEIESL